MKYLYEGKEFDGYICDIDPEWESEFILYCLPKERAKNKKELSYLMRYQLLLSNYYRTKDESEYAFYEKELAKLENNEIIKRIVEREGPKDLIINMTFAKTELNINKENYVKRTIFDKVIRKMKKWLSVLMIFAIAFTLVSCKDEKEQVQVFEYEMELKNLTEIINGEDILRYPKNYDGKQLNFYGYVFDYTESTILVTPIEILEHDIAGIKEGGAFLRYTRREKYTPIEIPYTNDKSPRLLIGDAVTFTGTVRAKLVDGDVTREIDTITNMKIIEN